MTAHNHRTIVPGCYRCELGQDEARVPEHVCDGGVFDRVVCAEPCGAMHFYCSVCDELQDECLLE